MATAKWSSFSAESSNVAGTSLDSKATGTTSFIVDIDNTVDKNLYITFWITLGSITPTNPSITLFFKRKRSGSYSDNVLDQIIVPINTGTSVKVVDVVTRIPGPGVYGLYWTNNMNVTSASSGNSVYYQTFSEEIT